MKRVGEVFRKDHQWSRMDIRSICCSLIASTSVYTRKFSGVPEGHNVVAWENGSMPLDLIEKGTQVGVQGRLRCCRYVGENGEPRTCYEVIASNVEILP